MKLAVLTAMILACGCQAPLSPDGVLFPDCATGEFPAITIDNTVNPPVRKSECLQGSAIP